MELQLLVLELVQCHCHTCWLPCHLVVVAGSIPCPAAVAAGSSAGSLAGSDAAAAAAAAGDGFQSRC